MHFYMSYVHEELKIIIPMWDVVKDIQDYPCLRIVGNGSTIT